jgi:hypothetical protein
MRARETLRAVAGSIVIYIVVAACSGGGDTGMLARDGGASDGHGLADTLTDALTNPVKDARADVEQSGSRLKAKHYVGVDGSSAFAGWHDSQLNVDCYYETAADGVLRCLPAGGAGVGPFYSDAGCTTLLALSSKACAAPQYAQQIDTATCPSTPTYHVFAVASPFTGTVYEGTPATCPAAPSTVLQAYNLYTIGPEVSPTQFLQASLQTDP